MMWDYNDAWGHGSALGGWMMFIGMIVIVVAVVFLVVYLVRQSSRSTGGGVQGFQGYPQAGPTPPAPTGAAASSQVPAPETPRDILKRRYASGEIDRDEYLQKLADLGG